MEAELTLEEKLDKPWWNRPLLGEKTLIDYLFGQSLRINIPPEYLTLYNSAIEKTENINLTLKALFNEKFASKDFLAYARIQSYLDRYYQHKKHYFIVGKEFFKPLLDNLDVFIKLNEIEKEYNDSTFLEFYHQCLELIKQQPNKLIFQEKLRKLKQYFQTQVDQEKEQVTISVYTKYLFALSESPHLLNIFYQIKINRIEKWELLKKIKEFIDYNIKHDIEELKCFVLLVKNNENELKEIATKIIKIKKEEGEDFLIISGILQYITLSYKYEQYYSQFQLFLSYLSKWEKTYSYIINFREKYPSDQYYHPPYFKVRLAGFDLYKSYHDYLNTSYLTKYI
ncbi:hypothetical protein [Geminocystis sp. NIES-3709]|uniref:hypothetical protein n=1 Tax=Geminocystis sp. NIES-3709 TaxID=1617448 RepID=UPI0005FC5E96|nr:hypothetical protein [Geminocystis sp. NIES-3709]BAQ64834.1 hypothetical protein GM3709_1599 [Geminocystis sp. NIES-3709]